MSAQQAQVLDNQQLTDPSDYQFSGNDVTVDNKRRLVDAYRQRGTIQHAAATVGVSRKCVHHYINTDPVFAEAMADSHEDSVDILEASGYERAFKSDLLTMFYLKAHRPKYRDKVQVDLGSVQEQIDAMVSRMDEVSRRQLPQVMGEFIDTSYSESEREYQSNEYQPQPSDPRLEQKEQPPE